VGQETCPTGPVWVKGDPRQGCTNSSAICSATPGCTLPPTSTVTTGITCHPRPALDGPLCRIDGRRPTDPTSTPDVLRPTCSSDSSARTSPDPRETGNGLGPGHRQTRSSRRTVVRLIAEIRQRPEPSFGCGLPMIGQPAIKNRSTISSKNRRQRRKIRGRCRKETVKGCADRPSTVPNLMLSP